MRNLALYLPTTVEVKVMPRSVKNPMPSDVDVV